MKKIFMLLVACVAMVFVSCSKDDDGDNETPFGGKQVSKITYKEASGEISSYVTYEYDKSGRVITEAWREDGENDVYNYTYENDKITIVNKYDGDTYTTVYTLVNGIITSSLATGEETEKTTYFYNENDELIKASEDGYPYTYTWTNGNITKQTYSGYDYEYTYSEKGNKTFAINNFTENMPNGILFSYGYFGKSNKNLMSGRTRGTYDIRTYEYEFDGDGNITTMKEYCTESGTKTLNKIVIVEYK
ncbi:hypothetical protein DXA95_17000 [Odoribacter sp. OF09-27XD]|jgi:YD repeat-containing protein|nr:hypothetical protein [Odoribacter sp. OF09-27XD]RHV87553.1 hypothetical protein DXA95_17000 [Odoribacter sp. OF09-27XD]